MTRDELLASQRVKGWRNMRAILGEAVMQGAMVKALNALDAPDRTTIKAIRDDVADDVRGLGPYCALELLAAVGAWLVEAGL